MLLVCWFVAVYFLLNHSVPSSHLQVFTLPPSHGASGHSDAATRAPATYRFCGMSKTSPAHPTHPPTCEVLTSGFAWPFVPVCYYGKHYVSLFARRGRSKAGSGRGEWLLFDDAVIRPLGTWADVKRFCVRAKYQPTVRHPAAGKGLHLAQRACLRLFLLLFLLHRHLLLFSFRFFVHCRPI